MAESAVPIRCTKPQSPIFTPWCAGGGRHARLVRKHVPDSDPGCALQSTSMPALHRRNVPNCRPMADGGMRKCSAVEDFARRGACPPLGSGWGVAESAAPIRCTKPQLRHFIPWCAGGGRHARLVRKHVPDSDPGCALQSTSMPALHRRNVPNCRPMADGGMRKCSAVEDFARRGACPPLGSGWGVAESAAPIRCTKPQLRHFIPWCAGGGRHARLVRKHVPDSDPGCALQSTSMPALHRRNVPNCRPMADGGMRKCSAVEDFARRGACPPLGSGWGVAESAAPIRCTKPQLRHFIPWCAGASRHERLL